MTLQPTNVRADVNSREKFGGPRIIALAFIILNLSVGLTHGSFGPLVLPMVERFDTRISIVSLAMSFMVSTSGLLVFLMGMVMNRFSIRAMMAAGAVLSAVGYVLLVLSGDITGVLISYGLFIGPGGALLGFLPCYTLVSRWYVQRQGRAFGIIGLPLLLLVMPLVVTKLLPAIGFEGVVLMIATVYLLSLLLIWMLIERPEDVGQRPLGTAAEPTDGMEDLVPSLTIPDIFRSPIFLLLIVATGLNLGPQVAKGVHLMPIMIERGFDLNRAALLLSISGGAAILGSLIFGALVDRISAALTLAIVSGLQALSWLIVISTSNFPLLVLDSVIMGLCAGGFVAPKSVLILRVYGRKNYAMLMGASGLATLPFLFGIPPLIGVLRENVGNYELPVILLIVGLGVAVLCCLSIQRVASGADSAQRPEVSPHLSR